MSIAIISSHPIQYHAPVYRTLQQKYHLQVNVIYGSDFSVVGYYDKGFGERLAWDTDLLSGYESIFLSRVGENIAVSSNAVSTKGMSSVLSTLNPKVILLLGYQTRFNVHAFIAARRMKCPLFLRAETTDHNRKRSQRKQFIRDIALRRFYRQFARLLYIGERSKAHYQRLGCREEQLVFSPYCVDTIAFNLTEESRQLSRNTIRPLLGIPSNKVVLLMSGKLTAHKSPDLLLDAVRSLSDNLRERITVLFLGDGEMRPILEKKAEDSPPIDVRFLGFQNQSKLSQYYHAADLLVLPSKGETWGLVVNEALYHGLPCIVSTSVGCQPDLVIPGETGEYFETGSLSGLQEAIIRGLQLIENPKVRRVCRQTVSHYSIDTAARSIFDAYSSLATNMP